jgi:hypothetical protein
MSTTFYQGSEVRLVGMMAPGDKTVMVRNMATGEMVWADRAGLLTIDDVARNEGVAISLKAAHSRQDNELMVCSCHGDVVWHSMLLDPLDHCPLSGSGYAEYAWADVMSWVISAAA